MGIAAGLIWKIDSYNNREKERKREKARERERERKMDILMKHDTGPARWPRITTSQHAAG